MVVSDQPENRDQVGLEKSLFVIGLAVYAGGQSMISLGRSYVDSLSPIDFAHWALLLGALLLVPYSISTNRRTLGRLSSYTLLIGVAGIVGMCVIDFIIWSYPPGAERQAFIAHVSAEPSVWVPFIHVGPWLFGIGICLISLRFLTTARVGFFLVLVGSIISATTTSWFTVFAYAIIAAGYVVCFRAPEHGS